MPEHITKERAIDEVWDAITMRDDPELGRVIEENIERVPAADVVEVVRCRDCVGKKSCYIWGTYLDDDDYCSHGCGGGDEK